MPYKKVKYFKRNVLMSAAKILLLKFKNEKIFNNQNCYKNLVGLVSFFKLVLVSKKRPVR